MQITIDKKTGIFLGVIAVLVTVIIALLGLQRHSRDFPDMDHGSMHHDASSHLQMVGSDVMFLQMMIPHHQQAINISRLAIDRSQDAEVVTLAKAIRNGQTAELAQMRSWLTDAHEQLTLPHSMGDGAGGMLSQADLTKLQSLSGKDFDVFWLTKMIAHHEGALHMVTMIQDSPDSNMRRFGGEIDSVQSGQIDQMTTILKRLGA